MYSIYIYIYIYMYTYYMCVCMYVCFPDTIENALAKYSTGKVDKEAAYDCKVSDVLNILIVPFFILNE
jgi:hypothetical protein